MGCVRNYSIGANLIVVKINYKATVAEVQFVTLERSACIVQH